ncbi:MAG: DUF429 domain-containing protein [Thermoprotei archaeon]|nr:MAG: DUF429 domain-containing protein [Thermoprotei archaeon]RLE90188.1 MAG: DUF429 domain-containing protein [Thermoprotei archaeon]
MVSIGIDLAGVSHRPTGICILKGNTVRTTIVFTDEEILNIILYERPNIIAIDAPLALPRGKTLDSKNCIRECDRALWRMGIKFFPINFGGMRKLTLRGIELRRKLENLGFIVIETYPGAVQDILGVPRAKRDRENLRKRLIEIFNLEGDILYKSLTLHELDAITCAIVGKLYLEGKYMAIGDPDEILMILPEENLRV